MEREVSGRRNMGGTQIISKRNVRRRGRRERNEQRK
jgi:hypothetical protein